MAATKESDSGRSQCCAAIITAASLLRLRPLFCVRLFISQARHRSLVVSFSIAEARDRDYFRIHRLAAECLNAGQPQLGMNEPATLGDSSFISRPAVLTGSASLAKQLPERSSLPASYRSSRHMHPASRLKGDGEVKPGAETQECAVCRQFLAYPADAAVPHNSAAVSASAG
jgi:hypothetical protein